MGSAHKLRKWKGDADMADFIVGGILILAVGAAAVYLRKAKKQGKKCIGCPSGGCCSGKCGHH